MAAVKASATYPAPRAAAWAIYLPYPVALERTVATEMERTDLRMEDISARALSGACQHLSPAAAPPCQQFSESSGGVTRSAEPDHLGQRHLVRGRARPKREKLK